MAWYLADELAKRKLAYLHLSEPDWAGALALSDAFRHTLRALPRQDHRRRRLHHRKAETLLKAKLIDAVAFGRPFIGNPDLVSACAKTGRWWSSTGHGVCRGRGRLYRLSGIQAGLSVLGLIWGAASFWFLLHGLHLLSQRLGTAAVKTPAASCAQLPLQGVF